MATKKEEYIKTCKDLIDYIESAMAFEGLSEEDYGLLDVYLLRDVTPPLEGLMEDGLEETLQDLRAEAEEERKKVEVEGT